ncbi:hypothetical protein Tco_0199091 [Tanacetum coccineum]
MVLLTIVLLKSAFLLLQPQNQMKGLPFWKYGSGLSPCGSAGGFEGSHLGDRGAIYGGTGGDPDASYDRTTGDREAWLGVSYGGHGASYDRTISDRDAVAIRNCFSALHAATSQLAI